MGMMLSDTYDAFIDAGASVAKAKKASEEISEFKNDINEIKMDLGQLKWMVGLILAGTISLVLKAFF